MKKLFTLLLVFTALSVSTDAWDLLEITGPHELTLGPQVYSLKRERQGGTFQKGFLYGGYLNYQRLRWNGFYAEGNVSYASGDLKGKTASGASLKSTLNEFLSEGTLGWTFGLTLGKPISITPYAGYGTFRSTNEFRHPSPLLCRFEDTFQFPIIGIYGLVYWTPCLSFGVNFKARWMEGAKEKVSGDEEMGTLEMMIGDNWLYELQLPITYQFNWNGYCLNANLIPFWDRRDFGGREGYPMDFIQTRYTIYGLRLLLGLNF